MTLIFEAAAQFWFWLAAGIIVCINIGQFVGVWAIQSGTLSRVHVGLGLVITAAAVFGLILRLTANGRRERRRLAA